jgi:hypothetical protein
MANTSVSVLRRFYRIFRWVVLLGLVVALVLAITPPGDVPEAANPGTAAEQARQFESKLQQLQEARSRGESGAQAEFSAGEINAFIAERIARRNGVSAGDPNAPATAGSASDTDDAKTTRSSLKDFRVRLENDVATGFFVVDFHGKDLDVTMYGRPGAADGSMTFSPTGFKVGSLPLPVWLVEPVLRRRLDQPEMRQRLKLPEYIGDLHVQNGEMVLTGK